VKQAHPGASDKDPARLNGNHPDISNPPVYPVVLAGLMKVLPFQFDTSAKGALWSTPDPDSPGGRRGIRYQPDFLITFFNQFLFLVMLLLVFFWARRLFDFPVALLSVVLLLTAEVLWRFSASGFSTMLLLVIFMGLIWCLTLWESELSEPKWGFERRGAAEPGGGRPGWSGGAHALLFYLPDYSGGAVPRLLWRAAPFAVLRGGPGGVCGSHGAVAGAQLCDERNVVRNGEL